MVLTQLVILVPILFGPLSAQYSIEKIRGQDIDRDEQQYNHMLVDAVQNDQDDVVRLDEEEPGFDLTDEEKIKFKIWPKGVIPFFIDTYSFDKGFRHMLRKFLKRSTYLTGLHFQELENLQLADQFRYVFFINRRGVLECQDYTTTNFTNEGVQKVVIGYDCFSDGEGPGSLILALAGVPPMHRAPDRDSYIVVSTQNALPDKAHLFDILPNNEWLFHDRGYDWFSAGHYTWHKYTRNGFAPISPKNVQSHTFIPLRTGEFKRLSGADVWKIRMLYSYKSKKGRPAEKSQCNKLFRPGRNFSSYFPKSDEELTPRAKPNKYLGIEDTKLENPENEENADADADKEPLEVDTAEITENSVKPNNNDGKRLRVYNKRATAQDPLFEQSDFDTKEKEDRIKKNRHN